MSISCQQLHQIVIFPLNFSHGFILINVQIFHQNSKTREKDQKLRPCLHITTWCFLFSSPVNHLMIPQIYLVILREISVIEMECLLELYFIITYVFIQHQSDRSRVMSNYVFHFTVILNLQLQEILCSSFISVSPWRSSSSAAVCWEQKVAV